MKRFTFLVLVSVFIFSCVQKTKTMEPTVEVDMATLENEIESRLREYEGHLKNGDSIALGTMYTIDAERLPSTKGRPNITTVIGGSIRNGVTGSSYKTTHLWGNDQLLVEDGKGAWSHENGQVAGSGNFLLV